MKTQFALFTVGAIALVGCGSQQSKLSPEQSDKFNDTLTAVGRIERASASAKPSTRSAAASVTSDDLETKMSQRLTATGCAIDFEAPDSGATNFTARYRVDGRTCPVSMDYRVVMNTDIFEGKLSYDVDASYKVADSDYAKLNDVDSLTAKGGFKVNREDDKLVLSGTVTGSIHSQKNGKVDFTMAASGEQYKNGGGNAIEQITFRFTDFTAELKTAFEDNAQKYYLNDQSISEDEYKAYLTKAGTLFQLSPVNSQKH